MYQRWNQTRDLVNKNNTLRSQTLPTITALILPFCVEQRIRTYTHFGTRTLLNGIQYRLAHSNCAYTYSGTTLPTAFWLKFSHLKHFRVPEWARSSALAPTWLVIWLQGLYFRIQLIITTSKTQNNSWHEIYKVRWSNWSKFQFFKILLEISILTFDGKITSVCLRFLFINQNTSRKQNTSPASTALCYHLI